MPERVRWDGARNAMDLGGIPLPDGTETVRGRCYRSAASEWMTPRGWQQARDAGVRTVVDLRNPDERGRRPCHPAVPENVLAGITFAQVPTEDPDDPRFLADCVPCLDSPKSWTPNMRLYPEKIAAVLRAVAEARGSVLVHCAGGGDRTGMIVSILLALNGVDEEAVADHYEAGFRGAAEHPTHPHAGSPGQDEGRSDSSSCGAGTVPDDLDTAVALRRPQILAWLRGHDLVSYLLGAGLTDGHLQRLRTLLRSRPSCSDRWAAGS